MTGHSFLAFDLGAESGRAILGSLSGDRLVLEEIHRFPNGPVRIGQHLYWDVLCLWSEIQAGISMAVSVKRGQLGGIGVDTWGVDFALLGNNGGLLGNPYHYRDPHTDGILDQAFGIVAREDIYQRTGIQFMQINSLFQLLAMRLAGDPVFEAAHTFLTIPDLFNYWLCGRMANEYSIASTTQCLNVHRKDWAEDLLSQCRIPRQIFQKIIQPGIVLDQVSRVVCQETGCSPVPVIATGSHDTASAVAAVPADQPDFIYLSSGTWSLMGIEISEPIVNQLSLDFNFTNEGGVGGKIRFLKNIMGMWLLQECRREWARQGSSYTWDDLTALASQAEPLQSLIFPGDASFLPPGNMSGRIQAFCKNSGQLPPQTAGAVTRCVLESLALEYRWVAEKLEELSGRSLPVIHIIGGGSRNRLLNQFTADASGRKVVAGPVEATAAGNILVQALALGVLPSLADGRALVRCSFDVGTYEPGSRDAWDEAYSRYLTLRTAG